MKTGRNPDTGSPGSLLSGAVWGDAHLAGPAGRRSRSLARLPLYIHARSGLPFAEPVDYTHFLVGERTPILFGGTYPPSTPPMDTLD